MSSKHLRLVDRLLGIYHLPVNDGAGLLNGSDTFTRTYGFVPRIQREAAIVINGLHKTILDVSNQAICVGMDGPEGNSRMLMEIFDMAEAALKKYEETTNLEIPDGPPDFPWRGMDSALTLMPILAWCEHGADPIFYDDGKMTPYGAACEGLSHVEDGPHVLVWGGESVDEGEYGEILSRTDAWWYRLGSNFEEAANPVAWMPIPHWRKPK